jgi:hypothetical protein
METEVQFRAIYLQKMKKNYLLSQKKTIFATKNVVAPFRITGGASMNDLYIKSIEQIVDGQTSFCRMQSGCRTNRSPFSKERGAIWVASAVESAVQRIRHFTRLANVEKARSVRFMRYTVHIFAS